MKLLCCVILSVLLIQACRKEEVPGILNYGEMNIGFRIEKGNSYRYGYISLKSEKAKVTLHKSVFITNKSECLVKE